MKQFVATFYYIIGQGSNETEHSFQVPFTFDVDTFGEPKLHENVPHVFKQVLDIDIKPYTYCPFTDCIDYGMFLEEHPIEYFSSEELQWFEENCDVSLGLGRIQEVTNNKGN